MTKDHGNEDSPNEVEDFQRHIIEDGVKAAIFGSNSYDPIKQVFEPRTATSEHEKSSNNNQSSTVYGHEYESTAYEENKHSKNETSTTSTTTTSTTTTTTTTTKTPTTLAFELTEAEGKQTSDDGWWSRYKLRSGKDDIIKPNVI